MAELLPCPFCGGEADQVLTDYEQVQVEEVRCRDCWATVGGATEAAAILAWNHRAPVPATPDRMADVTLGAEAMLDAKAGEFKGSTPCDCRYGCCYHKDGPKGAGWYQTSDCPIHGKPSQGEGGK